MSLPAGRRSTGALACLAMAVSVAAGTEFMPPGLLGPMAADFGASDSAMGLLISVFPFAVGLAALPLTRLTAHRDRRDLIVFSLVGYVVSNLLMATAGSLAVAMPARLLGGLSHAVLLSVVPVVAARLVRPDQVGRAVSVLWIGTTAAGVALVPLGAQVAAVGHWRWVFAVLAGAALLMAGACYRLVPVMPVGAAPESASRISGLPAGLLVVGAATFVALLANFVLFTYISPSLILTGVSGRAIAPLLFAFGLAGAAGLWWSAYATDHRPRGALLSALLLMAVALTIFESTPVLSLVIWGIAYGALPTFLNAAALRAAGNAVNTAPALVNGAFNLGAGCGGLIASGSLRVAGLDSLNQLAAGFALLALGIVALGRRAGFPVLPGPAPSTAPASTTAPAPAPAARSGRRGMRVGTLIVGSGMAGGALAEELLNAGADDLTVLSAGFRDGRATDPGDTAWRSENEHFVPVPGITGRIGGRATAWSGVVLPIDEGVLADWPASTRAELRRAYPVVLQSLESWRGRPLDAPTCQADAEMLGRIRAEHHDFRVVPRAERASKSFNPMAEVLARGGPASLLDGHRALRIGPGPGDSLQVWAGAEAGRREPLVLLADRVVVAAGTLETTRLVAQARAAVTGREQTVWPRLATKIKHGVLTRPAPWMTASMRPADLVYLVCERPDLQANLFFEIQLMPGRGPVLDLWWMAEQSVEGTGRIRFEPTGEAWPGTVHSSIGRQDQELVRERERVAGALLTGLGCPAADPAGPVLPDRAAAGAAYDGHPVRYLNRLGLSDHESGTLPLGEELDEDFGCRGVPGLWVAGPAAFVRAGAANPSLTIMALARIGARRLSERLGDQPGEQLSE